MQHEVENSEENEIIIKSAPQSKQEMQSESIDEVRALQRRNAQLVHDMICQAIEDRMSGAVPEPDYFAGGSYFG